MKQCRKCKIIKEDAEFGFVYYKSGTIGLKGRCKDCKLRENKKYYTKNKKKLSRQTNISRKKRVVNLMLYVIQYLKERSCVDCGETNIVVLEFDHKNPATKKYAISRIIHKGLPKEILDKEIKKCEVRCANCHQIRTAKQQGWIRANKVIDEKLLNLYIYKHTHRS